MVSATKRKKECHQWRKKHRDNWTGVTAGSPSNAGVQGQEGSRPGTQEGQGQDRPRRAPRSFQRSWSAFGEQWEATEKHLRRSEGEKSDFTLRRVLRARGESK